MNNPDGRRCEYGRREAARHCRGPLDTVRKIIENCFRRQLTGHPHPKFKIEESVSRIVSRLVGGRVSRLLFFQKLNDSNHQGNPICPRDIDLYQCCCPGCQAVPHAGLRYGFVSHFAFSSAMRFSTRAVILPFRSIGSIEPPAYSEGFSHSAFNFFSNSSQSAMNCFSIFSYPG